MCKIVLNSIYKNIYVRTLFKNICKSSNVFVIFNFVNLITEIKIN